METVFYIIVTVLFGIFIIFISWWLWKSMKSGRSIKDLDEEGLNIEDLEDNERESLSRFCSEIRRSRLQESSKKVKKK